MNTKAINSKMLAKLKDKKYRDLFIASQLNKIIPFQIRALRAARNNMTQEELAERAETTQSVISRIQNKGAANLNIKSLLKLASAFDVALVVRFEPIDRFIDWVDDLSPEAMSPKSSEELLAEAEHEKQGSEEAAVAKATPARPLRLADAATTTGAIPIQQTLRFDVPQLVHEGNVVGQTSAGHNASMNAPQTSDARIIKLKQAKGA